MKKGIYYNFVNGVKENVTTIVITHGHTTSVVGVKTNGKKLGGKKTNQARKREMAQMTSKTEAELQAMKSATETVAKELEYDIIEYVRSKGMWYVQVVTEDGPRTFDYDLMIRAAKEVRDGKLRKKQDTEPEFELIEDAEVTDISSEEEINSGSTQASE